MKRPRIRNISGAVTLAVLFCLPASTPVMEAQGTQDTMAREFENPPNSARPRVWWHWMNGNISREGIKLDLEWMHRIGLGGVTVFEGSIDTPQVVQKRLVYMTPDWKDAFRYATSTASGLGMEMAIASSPGWSATGGPWVPPAQGMKKMVWSATRVEGGKPFAGILTRPPDASGTFQDYAVQSTPRKAGETSAPPLPRFYADSAVVAYRLPSEDKTQAELQPVITSSGGHVDGAALSDGNVGKVALALPTAAEGKSAWVQFEYPHPQVIQAVTLATLNDMVSIFGFDDPHALYPTLEASDDGRNFRHITDLSLSSVPQRTTDFPAVTAKFFRVTFPTPAGAKENDPALNHNISELVLSSAARVNEFEKSAGFATVLNYYAISTPKVTPGSIVSKADVIDLTSQMKSDGSIDWQPPAGEWVILRIGYSLTGHENGPAPAEATGLEVDKLNQQYVKNYVDGYLKTYSDAVGPELMGKTGISYMLSDSTETGAQNWTDEILAEFIHRRGYAPKLWLPVLTGVVVDSPEASDKFLWDFRRTIAELFAQNHYGEIAAELHAQHLGYYAEALEYHRPSLGDDLEMRRWADIPMGAMWTYLPNEKPTPSYLADLRGAASVSHIYGQNLVGAESMTSNGPAWGWTPANLKRVADLELTLGVNRFMIHESAHQPLVDKSPGLTLGHYGLWFNRNDTWAEEAGPWVTYLARSSYLLQQGHFYGDVAYFYGQEGPLTAVFGLRPQEDAPQGYDFDFVNSDVILNHLSFEAGRLVTPGGTTYRLLYLGGTSRRITLPVLLKIRDLVSAGAVIAGIRPVDSPSLADDQTTFHEVVDQVWGPAIDGIISVHAFGKGKVYAGKTAAQALADLQINRDFEYTRPEPDTELSFTHRKLRNGDVYFVDNCNDRIEKLDATFRVDRKAPELWHADTGKIEAASYHIAAGRTTIPLTLNPYEAVFVVFIRPAVASSRSLPQSKETILTTLDKAWNVSFQPGHGVTGDIKFDKLTSWSDSSRADVKYFSGTATYTQTIQAPDDWFQPGKRLQLNLGDVRDLADVSINDQSLGIAWESPYQVDVTNGLRHGTNQLTIKVTNLWVNRLIGDQQVGITKKYTFTTFLPYAADSPLLKSGLLGPVKIVSVSLE